MCSIWRTGQGDLLVAEERPGHAEDGHIFCSYYPRASQRHLHAFVVTVTSNS